METPNKLDKQCRTPAFARQPGQTFGMLTRIERKARMRSNTKQSLFKALGMVEPEHRLRRNESPARQHRS
ncbi:hypothetical protein [Dokdonella sp.]|uniref:hypothetical protein n=1 Tax=Dokdonella sp. TaxID=2291710 RepID=UPI003C561A36